MSDADSQRLHMEYKDCMRRTPAIFGVFAIFGRWLSVCRDQSPQLLEPDGRVRSSGSDVVNPSPYACRPHAAFEDGRSRTKMARARNVPSSASPKAPGIIRAPRVATALTSRTPATLMTGPRQRFDDSSARASSGAESAPGPARTMPDDPRLTEPISRLAFASVMTRSLAQKLPESARKCHKNRARLVTTSHTAISRCVGESRSGLRVRPRRRK